MSESDLIKLIESKHAAPWRVALAGFVESKRLQAITIGVIIFNAILLGVETDASIVAQHGQLISLLDKACLAYFLLEILAKLLAYRQNYWRNGWNCFDFLVVAIALAPGAGPWSVLRSLRVLRVLRLLTVIPQLRKVVAAFMHAIPGLFGVIALMAIFFYTFAVLVTSLFSAEFPEWFGSIGKSLYSLFQIMTLESWSMGIVRPVMLTFPWAWAIFIPFIVVATFTILNLFIGIIVSTMQELSNSNESPVPNEQVIATIERLESELLQLKKALNEASKRHPAQAR